MTDTQDREGEGETEIGIDGATLVVCHPTTTTTATKPLPTRGNSLPRSVYGPA